jgi:DNA sulfur modification protein DndE
MKAPADTIRITKQGRDQLIKLRRITGIEHWNTLCRWALCVSLREPTAPLPATGPTEGGVEIQWKTLAGGHADIYAALIHQRIVDDGFGTDEEGAGKALRAHLHRGLGYLASGSETKSALDFFLRWFSR